MAKNGVLESVTVLDVTPDALLTAARLGAGLTHLESAFGKWDFLRDEGGQTYEVLTWVPCYEALTDGVRQHFADLGFDGNTAAFLQWIQTHRRLGRFVTIPENARLYRDRVNDLYVPRLYRDESFGRLCVARTTGLWSFDHEFVGFRKISV